MDQVYVAWQDDETREWIPVALLKSLSDGFSLQYTRGAKRCKSFTGLGRMNSLDKVYFSETLFPFFANRMISKSRPEYANLLRWLALDSVPGDPLSVLGVTGGVRATDSFEIVPVPRRSGHTLHVDFFSRGLRHLAAENVTKLQAFKEGDPLFVMRDVQNSFDGSALLLRTEDPKILAGYIPRYFSAALTKVLDHGSDRVEVRVKRVNPDAPLDMKLLCALTASAPDEAGLLESNDDFLPLGGAPGAISEIGDLDLEIAKPGGTH